MSIIKKVLNKTSALRNKYEKRSDARRYIEEYEEKISLPSEASCYKISLGYLERFLLMAEHKKIDNSELEGILKLDRWDEGCGFFSGEYTILNGNEKIRSGSFDWSGRGQIETSWNSFSKFD